MKKYIDIPMDMGTFQESWAKLFPHLEYNDENIVLLVYFFRFINEQKFVKKGQNE